MTTCQGSRGSLRAWGGPAQSVQGQRAPLSLGLPTTITIIIINQHSHTVTAAVSRRREGRGGVSQGQGEGRGLDERDAAGNAGGFSSLGRLVAHHVLHHRVFGHVPHQVGLLLTSQSKC